MAVVSRSRKQKINLSLHDILRSESIIQLAANAGEEVSVAQYEEKANEPFALSPIQHLYFKSAKGHQGWNRFNQSFLLRITRWTEAHVLEQAIRTVINRHSMLRARFSQNSDGRWQQQISNVSISTFLSVPFSHYPGGFIYITVSQEIDSSYRYRVHHSIPTGAIPSLVAESQTCLNIQNGPLFAADLFNVEGKNQLVFLVAHHLCVDMVSWRIIIQDIEEIIESGSLPVDKPLSFQTWCTLQAEHTKKQDHNNLLPFHLSPSNLSYWGMENMPNTYADVEHQEFSLDEEITESAMGSCHEALGTEPVDLFLSTIIHSFGRVFFDREVPTIYNEGHGREAWDSSIDLSRTVGWFTTICPLHVALESG